MRMRLTQDVEQEADGRRELTVEVFVHERRGGVAELQPAGAECRVRWLRGTADLNRQGSGTATVRVAAPGLYRVRSVASARHARDAYVEVTEENGALGERQGSCRVREFNRCASTPALPGWGSGRG
ncbi:hypothetical protein MYMAC_001499 [Corallococcus macrosporus DSM 14697]|uniref:Uncharacterized protein n=1 Tax=Corallococcus macrosporus DSM 14697 TaxID=1189310 RepID=A0A250JRA0_9BACT|nr:hypothetical protein MYMAC_001499 [Corallococcus macrosporus DSM 14697]